MEEYNRRTFLGVASSLASYAATGAQGAEQPEQGDVAASQALPLTDDNADRDPLGLRSGSALTPEAVRRAIARGIQFLKSTQMSNGTWPEYLHYQNGLTPLCTLALLNAGCNADDAAIVSAMKYLRDLEPMNTYACSLQTMVFCELNAKADREVIRRNVAWLESRQHPEGGKRGMWAIAHIQSSDHTDNSMTHFAMLALHSAERAGVAVSPHVWATALDYWQRSQNSDGSWGWGPLYPGTGSMTCAGIAALVIAGGAINNRDARIVADQVQGCGVQLQDPFLEKSLRWLERYFSVRRNPGTEFWHSYYLYALERAGRMLARRFFASHDWYREGARQLVASQLDAGAWPPDTEFQHVDDKNVSTSFSLMFLAKGRWPVVATHLKHRPFDDWNRHRTGLRNLIDHVEQEWERTLTHQIVDLAQAKVDDLLEAPVAFINGRERPQFSSEEKATLRAFVEQGGFIFAEQCCGGAEFDNGFRAAMREFFPDSDTQLQPLPPDHPVWFAEFPIKPELPLWGIDVGCRTAVIYCPFDLSCYWELDRLGRDNPELEPVSKPLLAARHLGINIVSYATGREVAFKNPAPVVANATAGAQAARGAILMANVRLSGSTRAASGALRKILRRAAEDYRLSVDPEPHEATLAESDLYQYHVLYMHGRNTFELSPSERERLREYVERGGTVIADALCTSTSFANSFRHEMGLAFPSQPLRAIPDSDPLFTTAFGGTDITRVERQTASPRSADAAITTKTVKTAPTIEAIKIDGRLAVFFSPFDLSCALESKPIGCTGYTRLNATQIVMNLVLYSLNQ